MKHLLSKSIVRYILAGGLGYAIELFILLSLHRFFGLSVELATGIAFWISIPTSFSIQKLFAFKDYQKTLRVISKQITAYGALVIFNYIFTLVIVALFPDNWIIFSRTLALLIVTLWNYLFYHYLFIEKTKPPKPTP